jgi:phosphoserine aminotransferase
MTKSTKRVFNFNPGPAALPLPVLEQAQKEMLDYKGTGMSVMEISHRSKEFEAIVNDAQTDLRDLMGIPAGYKILFLQGGGIAENAIVPMNLLGSRKTADFVVTGCHAAFFTSYSVELGFFRSPVFVNAIVPVMPS